MAMMERLTTAVARSFFISPFDKSIIAKDITKVKLKVSKIEYTHFLINN